MDQEDAPGLLPAGPGRSWPSVRHAVSAWRFNARTAHIHQAASFETKFTSAMALASESASTSAAWPPPSGALSFRTRKGFQSNSGTFATTVIRSCERTAEIAKPRSAAMPPAESSAGCRAGSHPPSAPPSPSGSSLPRFDPATAPDTEEYAGIPLPGGQIAISRLRAEHRFRLR